MVSEDGPATETSPGFNSNGDEVAVHPCVYLITTFLINCADKGESHTPAVKVILPGELQYKLGKPLYSFTRYEKVKRVTIPVYDSDYQILMISSDIDGESEYGILEKVLPLLKKSAYDSCTCLNYYILLIVIG